MDLDEFAEGMEGKNDKKFAPTSSILEDVEDVSSRIGDMQAVNLFGVQVSRQETRDSDWHSRELTKVLGDLMQAAVNADPQGTVSDFSKRKAVSVHSPYETEDIFSFLKFDASDSQTASLVIDAKLGGLKDLMDASIEGKLNSRESKQLG
jgi:hypothetical protein